MSGSKRMRFSNGGGITLRPYQVQAVADLRTAMLKGARKVLLQAGTGSGKTVVASSIMHSAVEKGRRVLFLAHRRELIDQCADKLERFGVPNGIIMAGRELNTWEPVQVASVDTLRARALNRSRMKLPETDLIVIDEAHRATAPTYRRIVDAYPEAFVLGLTATPARGDGRGLGEMFDAMVCGPTNASLTPDYLVPISYYAPDPPDLRGVRTRGGDWREGELEKAVDKPKLVGDVVGHWLKHGAGRQTVVFASGVAHSRHLQEEFEREGVAARHLDGETPLDEREEILSDLASGRVQVVTNCMVLTEGWDCPPVACCVLARPTKSLGLYLQMAGRTLRTHDGKDDCLILDHGGMAHRFAEFIEPHGDNGHVVFGAVPWSLDGREKLADRIKDCKKDKLAVVCRVCHCVFSGQRACPNCGTEPPKRKAKDVQAEDGKLSRIGGEKATMQEKARFLAELKTVAADRGYKNGWCANQYRERFGVWPSHFIRDVPPKPPGLVTMAWIRAKQREFALSGKGQS